MLRLFLLFAFLFAKNAILTADNPPTSAKLKALYNSLDQTSISQHLAFYRLYQDYPEGQKALYHAWFLLTDRSSPVDLNFKSLTDLKISIEAIIALVNRQPQDSLPDLSDAQLTMIEKLGNRLHNRKLKGYGLTDEKEVIQLNANEIDLARGLLLSQWGNKDINKIRCYEASLDLMALQIRARLSENANPEQKIRVINHYIFDELKFKFPPHSLYAKDIDLYTFLPSVLDSRRGVCLGVSILYICLAQRLNLNLEMITPPGHIYVRYRQGDKTINIETTARGIHLDSEEYLGVNTRSLQLRNIKEIIGLAHFNEAAVFWQQDDFQKALNSYQKATPYIPDDMLTKELMAYTYLLLNRKEEGENLLKSVENHIPDYAVSKGSLAEDYLKGNIDAQGIKVLFMHVDETRESILRKKEALDKIISEYPHFREGLLSLAITWLQLHRAGEALDILTTYHQLDDQNAEVEYYLTILNAERLNFPHAWQHFHNAQTLVEARNHQSKTLKNVKKALAEQCRE